MNSKVDAYIGRSQRWPQEMTALRAVLLGAELDEDIKWGKPCFGYEGRNIAIVQEMKDFLALMFFKGALIDDPAGVLEEQGPNSHSARRICFRSVDDVTRLGDAVRGCIREAIEVERAGRQVAARPDLVLAAELQDRLEGDPALRAAFEALTPGRRREYNLHFSDAKQPATRAARVERYAQQIMDGKGLRDR